MAEPTDCRIIFEPVRLADAALMRQDGVVLPEGSSVKAIRQAIRQLTALCGPMLWRADQYTGSKKELLGVIGMQMLDPSARRVLVRLYPIVLTDQLLSAISKQAFRILKLYRLELEIGAREQAWLPALLAAGWHEEGLMRSCRWNSECKRHEDVRMYALLKPQQQGFGSAFIPFSKAVVAVTGDQDGLWTLHFIRYGRTVDPTDLQEDAEWLGILDQNGCLVSREAWSRLFPDQPVLVTEQAPPCVLAAAGQVADYFAGRRTTFDVPVHLEQGSPFQQQVWRAIGQIPFGETWTYEALAAVICGREPAVARRMARAVGSACGANPLPLILPCHRVIGKNGHLIGFSGGLDLKEFLLAHEIMGLD